MINDDNYITLLEIAGWFEMALMLGWIISSKLKLALNNGSSKHGKAFLALLLWNWVLPKSL